jgi:hypothetical protein
MTFWHIAFALMDNWSKKILLDLQMQKFTTYLEFADILGRIVYRSERSAYAFGRRTLSESETEVIQDRCRPVWRNPAFINIVPQLLGEQHSITSEAEIYFLFQLTKFLDKEQVETEWNRDQHTSIFRSSAIINDDDEHDDKDICTLGDEFEFNHLVSNQTYRVETDYDTSRGVDFVVGKYKFPLQLAVSIPKVWMKGMLIGTSILSFRDSAHVRWNRKQKIYQDRIREGEEGRYWLWFIPNRTYILMDRQNLIAGLSNGSCRERKFDLRKYGEEIRD